MSNFVIKTYFFTKYLFFELACSKNHRIMKHILFCNFEIVIFLLLQLTSTHHNNALRAKLIEQSKCTGISLKIVRVLNYM